MIPFLQIDVLSALIPMESTRGSSRLPPRGGFLSISSFLFDFSFSKGEEKSSPIENTDATSQDAILHGRWCYIDFAMAS